MPGDNPNPIVDKTVDDLKTGMDQHNLTKVFDDLKQAQSSGDFDKFLKDLNAQMDAKNVLPGLDIMGLQDGKLVVKDSKNGSIKLVDQQSNLSEVKPGESRATGDKPADAQTRTPAEGQTRTPSDAKQTTDGTRPLADTPGRQPSDAIPATDGTRSGSDSRTRTPDAAGDRGQPTQSDGQRPERHDPVERGADGRVAKIEYAPGQSREFTYDKDGKPSEVKDSNGTTFTTKDGGKTWNMHDKSGDHAIKDLIVNRNGDMVYQDDKKATTVLRHDGSTIEANEKGQVTHIKTANGKDLEFGYNKESGVLEHVKNQWGTWDSKDGKSFTNKESGETWKGQVTIEKSGTYRFVNEAGEAHIVRPDGSTTQMDKGKVTEIEDAKGQKFTFKYDAVDGHLSEVTNEHGHWNSKDGHEFVRDDGVKWSGRVAATADGTYGWISDEGRRVIHKPNGEMVVDERRADAEAPRTQGDGRGGDGRPADGRGERGQERERPVDETLRDGSHVHRNKDGSSYRAYQDGTIVTDMVDGSRIKEYPNGGRVEMNPRGQVTFTDDGRGHSKEFKYSQNGELSEIRGMDGSYWHKVRPGMWVDDRGRGFRGEVTGVDKNGTAHYQPEGQRPFCHTIDGRVLPETGDTRDRHPGSKPRDQERGGQRPGGEQRPTPQQPGGDRPTPQQPGGDRPTPQQPGGDRPTPQQPGGDRPTPQQPGGDRPRDQQPTPTDRPAERPPERADAEKPAGPTKLEDLKAKDGVYNPLQPPGFDIQPGENRNDGVDTGSGNIPLDYRKLLEKKENDDGSISYKYEGELNDCGWMPWNWGDTNFTANEKHSKEGQLLERNVHYDSEKDLKFATKDGNQEIKGVTDVNTTWNKEKGVYETMIVTKDNRYRAEVGPDGKVAKLEKVTEEKKTDGAGDAQANVNAFSPMDGQVNPVRPMGIGEFSPGAAIDSETSGIDWRTNQTETLPDGSKYHRYTGQLADGTFDDTDYEAEEKVSKDGVLLETHIKYDDPVDHKYMTPDGKGLTIEDVKSVDTNRQPDGTYISQVKDKKGNSWFFVTDARGKVTKQTKVQQ